MTWIAAPGILTAVGGLCDIQGISGQLSWEAPQPEFSCVCRFSFAITRGKSNPCPAQRCGPREDVSPQFLLLASAPLPPLALSSLACLPLLGKGPSGELQEPHKVNKRLLPFTSSLGLLIGREKLVSLGQGQGRGDMVTPTYCVFLRKSDFPAVMRAVPKQLRAGDRTWVKHAHCISVLCGGPI